MPLEVHLLMRHLTRILLHVLKVVGLRRVHADAVGRRWDRRAWWKAVLHHSILLPCVEIRLTIRHHLIGSIWSMTKPRSLEGIGGWRSHSVILMVNLPRTEGRLRLQFCGRGEAVKGPVR